MRNIISFIIFLALLFPLSVLSQSKMNKILDERNGFKEFKIDDSYSKWKENLEFIGSGNYDIKQYLYTGSCCHQIFEFDIDSIKLGFKNDKLYLISLTTPIEINSSTNYVSSTYSILKQNFEELLQQEVYDGPIDEGQVGCVWHGTLINLVLIYDYEGLREFDGFYKTTSKCLVILHKKTPLEEGF